MQYLFTLTMNERFSLDGGYIGMELSFYFKKDIPSKFVFWFGLSHRIRQMN